MKSNDNELIVYRNETFAIDKTVVNRDGTPFIVGQLTNPHLMLTVTDTKFTSQERYKVNYFLPLLGVLPLFEFTNVIPLEEVLNADGEQQYSSFPNTYPSGYYNGEEVEFEEGDAVFSLTDADGNVSYKYREDNVWKDYAFRFVFTFDSAETKNWTEKTYYYSIQLVSGVITEASKTFDFVLPLLKPTKISVLSNLEGRMS